MNKHTPGPWSLQLVESDTGRIQHLCPMDDDGLSLLTVVTHNGKKFAAVYSADDARLIAAAPDLLEAAIECMAAGRNCVTADDDIAAMLRFSDAEAAMLSAIAKVTGATA